VAVDEAGRDDVTLGVDLVGTPLTNPSDGGDAAPSHTDVGAMARTNRRRRHRCGSPIVLPIGDHVGPTAAPPPSTDRRTATQQVVLHRSAPDHVEPAPNRSCAARPMTDRRHRSTCAVGFRNWFRQTPV
jgi:hypothetical protein